MTYKKIIESIKPIPYTKYQGISSYEKLAAYAACYLERKKVPLYFNYICIASFKFFPEKFCCDNEFTEYPSVDRLNRTIMHMHTSKSDNNYLIGSAKRGFILTELGRIVGNQVEAEIKGTKTNGQLTAPTVDMHKKGLTQNYERFVQSVIYEKYKTSKQFIL